MTADEQRRCRICGYPLDRKNRTGLCSNRTPACRKAREQLTADEKPGKFRIAIKAGDTFGRWTALEDYSPSNREILVRCECGIEKRLTGEMLTNGHSHGCRSCAAKFSVRPPRPLYLEAGMVFGRLTVLEDVASCDDDARCRCECGNEITTSPVSVKFGHTRSCRCLHRETHTTHGFWRHPLYRIWGAIIQRCTNPNDKSYYNYGGRGIAICERWRDVAVFITELEREIGPRPEGVSKSGRALYSLDRIDNERGYEPGNMKWSTRSEQALNQRKIPKLTQERDAAIRERNALAAELAALKAIPAPRKRKVLIPAGEALF